MIRGLSWAKSGLEGRAGRRRGTDLFLGGLCAATGVQERLDMNRELSTKKSRDYKNY